MVNSIEIIESKLYETFALEEEKGFDYLKDVVKNMDYPTKLNLFSTLLCDEWYTNDHLFYISRLLDIFGKSK